METADRFIFERVEDKLSRAYQRTPADRPYVTLTYASSLDGSIGGIYGQTLALSNVHSQTMTHGLRARHDAILVGINTVLVDNPRLTVRLTPGVSPRPIIVDSQLRFPLNAKLLEKRVSAPIIATTLNASPVKEQELRAAGAEVLRVPTDANGSVNLQAMLAGLATVGIKSLMVEGGGRIIKSFLTNRLANQLILTICPVLVGGVKALHLDAGQGPPALPTLENIFYTLLGNDMILMADLK